MSYMLITGAVFHRIEDGLVYWETASGDDRFPKAMPIAEFRAILEDGRRIIAEYDTEQRTRVVAFPKQAKRPHRVRPSAHPE